MSKNQEKNLEDQNQANAKKQNQDIKSQNQVEEILTNQDLDCKHFEDLKGFDSDLFRALLKLYSLFILIYTKGCDTKTQVIYQAWNNLDKQSQDVLKTNLDKKTLAIVSISLITFIDDLLRTWYLMATAFSNISKTRSGSEPDNNNPDNGNGNEIVH